MRKMLRNFANRVGAHTETDKAGNLLITKGVSDTYPCVAAHMDQVQRRYSRDYRVVQFGDTVMGWSDSMHSMQGLGADDKNGIFIALYCLQKYDAIKVAFFVEEEVGCIGSASCDLSFFADCRFIIQPDRKGASDLITEMSVGKVASDEFIQAIQPGAALFGYREAEGTITDVGTLVENGVGISCINLSCGYYNAHTAEEVTVLSELENCLRFVTWIIDNCTERYEYTPDLRGWFGSYGRTYLYNTDWDKLEEEYISNPDADFDDVYNNTRLLSTKKEARDMWESIKSWGKNW